MVGIYIIPIYYIHICCFFYPIILEYHLHEYICVIHDYLCIYQQLSSSLYVMFHDSFTYAELLRCVNRGAATGRRGICPPPHFKS